MRTATAIDAPLLLSIPSRTERPVPKPKARAPVARRIGAVLAVAALAVALADTLHVATAAARPHVHPGVHRALREIGSVNLIVTLAADHTRALETVRDATFESRGAKIDALRERLEAHSAAAAVEVESVLHSNSSGERSTASLHAGFKRFWISNQVLVTAASLELVEQLAQLESVRSIREQAVVKLDALQRLSVSSVSAARGAGSPAQTAAQSEWGVSKIGANKVWAEGFTGQGVVVATIDGGVRWTHEALEHNFRGAYGWYDPEKQSAEPYDINSHGTHVMGTIAGANGIGVAPGATWIACKGCRVDDCLDEDLLACAQFMLCPTDPQGKNPDCTKAPHVVNNSWGSPGGDDWYQAAVDAWVAAGIVPVFSHGNVGPACGSAGSPGDYLNVIGVGASTPDDGLAPYSARGPSAFGGRKPDISAPGFAVRSSIGTNDTSYAELYGTSMAAPHVTGAVALVLSAQPGLSVSDIKNVLLRTAEKRSLASSGSVCDGTPDRMWPNNQYGSGRLNVLDAYNGFMPLPWVTKKPAK